MKWWCKLMEGLKVFFQSIGRKRKVMGRNKKDKTNKKNRLQEFSTRKETTFNTKLKCIHPYYSLQIDSVHFATYKEKKSIIH